MGDGPLPVCRATEELCSLGLGAMAEVGTIVGKVKEVLSQRQLPAELNPGFLSPASL